MAKLTELIFGDRRDPRAVLADEFDTDVPESGTPPRAAILWGLVTLKAAGVGAEQRVEAIAVLRRERDLGLRPTKFLVDHLAAHHSR